MDEMTVILVCFGAMLIFGRSLANQYENRKIVKLIENNSGVWIEKTIFFDPNTHKRKGIFRRSRFKSLSGKFEPYDSLKKDDYENFIEVCYFLAPGRPKGYRVERIAHTTLKILPA